MLEYRCTCGRKFGFDVLSGRFKEIVGDVETTLKIRCSERTKEAFKKMKERNDLPSYESLLQLLMSIGTI